MVYWDISFYTKGSHGLSFFIMRGCRTSVYNLLTGKKLTVFDLMVAATWSDVFDLREEIEKIKQGLESKNYDDVDDITILKCLAAVMTNNQDRKSIFSLREKAEILSVGLDKTKKGLFRAIDFLTTELSVYSYDFLPYDFQLVFLTYFFSVVTSTPTSNQLEVIKKWFWRSSFAEKYQGANETLLEETLSDGYKLARGIPNNLLDFVPDITVSKLIRNNFIKGTALTNSFIALIASKRPRNLASGTYIDVANSLSNFNRKEFHHVFPSAFLRTCTISSSPNSLCNIALLTSLENKKLSNKPPKQYFNELKESLFNDYENILRSNLVPIDIETFSIDYDLFLEYRAETILDAINELI